MWVDLVWYWVLYIRLSPNWIFCLFGLYLVIIIPKYYIQWSCYCYILRNLVKPSLPQLEGFLLILRLLKWDCFMLLVYPELICLFVFILKASAKTNQEKKIGCLRNIVGGKCFALPVRSYYTHFAAKLPYFLSRARKFGRGVILISWCSLPSLKKFFSMHFFNMYFIRDLSELYYGSAWGFLSSVKTRCSYISGGSCSGWPRPAAPGREGCNNRWQAESCVSRALHACRQDTSKWKGTEIREWDEGRGQPEVREGTQCCQLCPHRCGHKPFLASWSLEVSSLPFQGWTEIPVKGNLKSQKGQIVSLLFVVGDSGQAEGEGWTHDTQGMRASLAKESSLHIRVVQISLKSFFIIPS